MNIDNNVLINKIYEKIEKLPKISQNNNISYSLDFQSMLSKAKDIANSKNHEYISILHLLMAILEFNNYGLDKKKL